MHLLYLETLMWFPFLKEINKHNEVQCCPYKYFNKKI